MNAHVCSALAAAFEKRLKANEVLPYEFPLS